MTSVIETDLLVLGGGPGGYTAAFRAADLGLSVVLVEKRATLGGVCLNVGCIPSKALLHCTEAMASAAALSVMGIEYDRPRVNLDSLRKWKDALVQKLSAGLDGLAKKRNVRVLHGEAKFTDAHCLSIADGTMVRFGQAIIAAGSRPVSLPVFPEDERIMDSTAALRLECIPEALLVVGGGVIGLELATVYATLGSRVTVVEIADSLLPGCDPDLVKPLEKQLRHQCEKIWLGTRVTSVSAREDGIYTSFEGPQAPEAGRFDRVLLAAGRKPNGARIGAESAGIQVDGQGFIPVDKQQRTNLRHIFAIGDIVGQPMLAHKASYEGKIAAEAAAGKQVSNDSKVIAAVAYTNPEVAWVGLTETEAKRNAVPYDTASFPWSASGRALSMNKGQGMTKILVDPETRAIVGVGMVGAHAGDLISEAALAIEMGAEPGDIALTIHPHPTLSETLALASEAYEGTLTELYMNK
ncbi:MAG: dihydrolipoyl dehydrogenase [Advenella sp.]